MRIRWHIVSVLLLAVLMNCEKACAQDDKAQELNNRLSLYLNRYGVQSKEYADCVLWCSMQVAEAGDITEAKRVLAHSERLFRKYGNGVFDGRDSIKQVLYLDTKSVMERQLGREYLQVRYMEKAVALKKQVFGFESEVYLNSLLDLAEMYAERFRNKQSKDTHNSGYETYVNLIKREFARLPESQRQTYWNNVSGYIEKTINIAHKAAKRNKFARSESLAGAAYNALLLSKGLLLNTTMAFETYVRESGVETAVALLNEKKKLMENGAETASLDSLDYAILNELAAHGRTYKVENLNITWESVQRGLKDDDLAVEFYRTKTGDYGALALRKSWNSPRIIPLREMIRVEKKNITLDSLLSYGVFNYEAFDPIPQVASKVIWPDELVKYFPKTDTGRVYFSAEGKLLITAVEYLPIPGYKPNSTIGTYYMMSDIYNLYRVSSPRELITASSDKGAGAAIFGGLAYQMSSRQLTKDSRKYPKQRSVDSDDSRSERRLVSLLEPLEGSKREADSIVGIIRSSQRADMEAISYTDTLGTEAAFKALNGQRKRVIHVATHGFFNDRKDAKGQYNPMQNSGLYMAGANRTDMEQTDADLNDGKLTAEEIALMDLQGMELVALSACETGLGIIGSDGVFGLQRGFKMAGTAGILMSLWKVDDEATTVLMTEFYRHWMDGNDIHDALHQACAKVRQNPQWSDPKYWAAFILLDGIEK